jgi:hypothetical protein|tara:strand:+ start:2090 stop:2479 length:390 start_codon:yes stop_codon:yes gene_type:complete
MNDNETAEYKNKSKSMFDEVCDPDSLVNINLEALTIQAIIKQFLSTKTSKTDLAVLIGLLEFWNREESVINIDSYSYFRSITKSTLADPNIARALKSLESNGFISKITTSKKLEYSFNIPYDILCAEIG